MKKKIFREFNTEGVKYKLTAIAIVALIVLGIGVASIVINHQPSEDANESVNAVDHKEKPDKVGFGGKVSVYVPGKHHKDENATEKVGEKIEAKVNVSAMNVTDAEIGAKVNATNVTQ
ncbi:MAG: hypothetical protein A7316_08635 [Candidatus Altiarchaeales archaeon WOR_SM1_86-2]|nr:MAG: hypothetical protein A7316_08635 [Candidatus Altiarchaeales archaeon WOR_SM1_86-2]